MTRLEQIKLRLDQAEARALNAAHVVHLKDVKWLVERIMLADNILESLKTSLDGNKIKDEGMNIMSQWGILPDQP